VEPSRFLINGQWRSSDRTRPVINPYTQQVVAEVCQASQSDIHDAIRAAVGAFELTRALQSYERAEILLQISAAIRHHKEDFARLITHETGKPISFSRAEVERSAFTFAVAAEESKRIGGEVLPLDLAAHSAGRIGLVRRFPVGPIAAITPFNFPLNLVAHKVAPALASGNTVVLKPSSNAPGVALLLGKITQETTLPPGALNVLPCTGNEVDQLILGQAIKLISFTGSPAVGWTLKEKAGKKKVVLELGGNAGVIVDEDADIEGCAPRIAQGAYGNAGQSCIAVQRVFVHESLFSRFVMRFVEISREIPTGDPLDEKTVVGPMITEDAAARILSWVNEAVQQGARVHCGGSRNGAVVEPTVLTGVSSAMKVCSEEVFAPVVTIEQFRDLRGAVDMVNESRYGLQAGLFTNNLRGAFEAYRDLEVGGVILNDFPTYRIDHMPYGGVKDSGFGREGIRYAIEEMTEPRLLVMNLS
jgi:glyceraldehyde-3-phosphate dehydrogenase (NADP+)